MSQQFDFLFFESIRLLDGNFHLLPLHHQRMIETRENHQITAPDFDLFAYLQGFEIPSIGLFKCRITYGKQLSVPEFIPYQPKTIRTLKIIECADLKYENKFTRREKINACFAKRGQSDDILITQSGNVTDTSFCNIVFFDGNEWITPNKPLLKGVQRAFLLEKGIIRSGNVSGNDIKNFQKFRLINAMMPWDEAVELPISAIID